MSSDSVSSDPTLGAGTSVATAPARRALPATDRPRPKQPVPWSVVLLDDDDHTYDYVIHMMQRLFAHPTEDALKIAKTVDSHGRAVCFTTHRELAELKRDQILAFGADPLLSRSAGSMSAIIEPAHGGDDGQSSDNDRRPS